MKKSELKEAIKSEIKSVLSEDINEIEFRPNTGLAQIKTQGEVDGADAITKELRQYNLKNVPDMDAYADGFVKGAVSKAMFYKDKLDQAIRGGGDSVLSEEIQVGDIVTLTTGGDELEVIDSRQLFGSDMMAYRVKKVDGTKFNANVDFPEIGDETVEYSADQLRPTSMMNEGTWSSGTYNEIGRFIQDVKNLRDKYYDIVGNDDVFDGLDRAEEAAREMMINAPENKSDVTFSDIREDEDEDDKKAYKGAAKMDKKKSKRDKVIDAYNEIGGGKEVKEKAKKAKEGDKEALNWLKTNQPKIKAYNDLKK